MKIAQMNISYSRFILFKLKIFGEIPVVTTIWLSHVWLIKAKHNNFLMVQNIGGQVNAKG